MLRIVVLCIALAQHFGASLHLRSPVGKNEVYDRAVSSESSSPVQSVAVLQQDEQASVLCDFISSNVIHSTSDWVCSPNLQASDYCSWSGITCDGTSITVIDIAMTDGLVPSTIGSLASLQELTLHYSTCNVNRTIPDAVGSLTNLEVLDLAVSCFHGSIPSGLTSLTKLKVLDLHTNYLSGSLPSGAAFPDMTSIDISGNYLVGSISAFNSPHLTYFGMNQNSFSGTIPSSGFNLSSALSVHLEYNLLSGTLPSFFADLPKLEAFYCNNNLFSGSLPAFQSSRLSFIMMNDNIFSGFMPSLPSAMGSMLLSNNRLEGSLPYFYSNNFPRLFYLYVSNNYFQGQLSDEFASTLLGLDVSSNELTGSIPDMSAYSLTWFLLNDNSLTGTIPSLPTTLQSIDFSANLLRGNIPDLSTHVSLTTVNLADNLLQGTVPDWFSPQLFSLELGENFFTGTIPNMASFASLRYLSLQDNHLTGTIPIWGPGVVTLELNSNYLTGPFPNVTTNFVYLQTIDFSDNQLTGTLPTYWFSPTYSSHLSGVNFLNLSHNSFHGTLPDTLLIRTLDLTDNLFNGTIPFAMLQMNNNLLNLALNMLTGTVPLVSNVKMLNLSHNELGGRLEIMYPNTKLNTASMDLSNNYFSGTLPTEMCNYYQLFELFLSNNRFEPTTCYPGCLRLVYQDFYSDFPRCYDDEVAAMCELGSTLSIATAQATNTITTTEYYESPHYTGQYYVDSKIFRYTGAFSYQISFSQLSQFTGSILIKWIGGHLILSNNGQGVSLPGVNSDTLIVYSSSVTITSNIYLDYGFLITVNVLTKGSGWSCTNETAILNGVSVSSIHAYPCTWTGVTCTFGQIASIAVSGLYLKGRIPDSIGKLTSLTSLDLSFNSITGSIPSSIGTLTSLSSLDLSSNSLTGSLPDSIGSTKLAYLTVSNNKLNGTIPEILIDMQLLYVIRLDANQFSGKLTNELCQLVESKKKFISVLNTRIDCFESCWSAYSNDSSIFTHDSTLEYCAPSSMPSSYPSASPSVPAPPVAAVVTNDNASFPTVDIILIATLGSVGLLLLGAAAYWKFIRNAKIIPTEEDIQLIKFRMENPIHDTVLDRRDLELTFVLENIATSTNTLEEKTAFDLILDAGVKYAVDKEVLFLLLEYQLPASIKENKNAESDCMNGNSAWGRIVQLDDERSVDVVGLLLMKYKSYVELLANGMDNFGRKYINIASSKCKDSIDRVLYLYERFELFEGPPEYKTNRSVVRFAYDHKRRSAGDKGFVKVALKFISKPASFQKEISSRPTTGVDGSNYFITILESYDGDSEEPALRAFRTDAIIKGYVDYPYCVVLEAADQNLSRFINSQRIAGHEWEEIRRIFKQLVKCVEYLHSHQVIHGDLKPNNAVVMGNSGLRLIDFDNSVRFNTRITKMKSSTAYCPPEYFRQVYDTVKNQSKLVSKKEETEAFEMQPSHDIWALGAMLYLLCTGGSLFLGNLDDNILDEEDVMSLYQWDDAMREKKLMKITDKLARNLISLMLTKDADKRIDASRVLDHPFLSGKQAVRLSGEEPEFDVFLSYRDISDSTTAHLLYDHLTAKGLRVWLDTVCLEPGQNWEIGFCEGLFKSDYFVCLVSKHAVMNPENDRLNWSKLTATSPCDNVLLEWTLALELKQRRLIKGVFPVFIGHSASDGEPNDKFYVGGRDVEDVSVLAVEEKLKMHLSREGCGLPYNMNYSARSVVTDVTASQGAFLMGKMDDAVKSIVNKVEAMVRTKLFSPRNDEINEKEGIK